MSSCCFLRLTGLSWSISSFYNMSFLLALSVSLKAISLCFQDPTSSTSLSIKWVFLHSILLHCYTSQSPFQFHSLLLLPLFQLYSCCETRRTLSEHSTCVNMCTAAYTLATVDIRAHHHAPCVHVYLSTSGLSLGGSPPLSSQPSLGDGCVSRELAPEEKLAHIKFCWANTIYQHVSPPPPYPPPHLVFYSRNTAAVCACMFVCMIVKKNLWEQISIFHTYKSFSKLLVNVIILQQPSHDCSTNLGCILLKHFNVTPHQPFSWPPALACGCFLVLLEPFGSCGVIKMCAGP